MMTRIKHDGNESYLILCEGEADKEAEFALCMAVENSIPGLLALSRHTINDERLLYYRISGMTSMGEIREPLTLTCFTALLCGIDNVLRRLDEYLIDGGHLLLVADYIYFDQAHCAPAFCLYPYEATDLRVQIRSLCEYFLEHIDQEDETLVTMAYQMYRMTRDEHFIFTRIVDELVRETDPAKDSYHKEGEILPHLREVQQTQEYAFADAKCVDKDWEEVRTKDSGEESARTKRNGPGIWRGLCLCLTGASFALLLFTCALKGYYYGSSIYQMAQMWEVQVQALILIILLALCMLIGARDRS
ncbi:MAG: hypothetical protein J6P60_01210 [Lachnospiraceae bacterium]|nr:hypothetical protein [Lachnospiraceae bacterium]